MSDFLVIVESPTKIETIKKYLGSNYLLAATFGHIKDLPVKKLGIDINKDFKPRYIVISNKRKVVKNLQVVAKNINNVYLAPDPDREGEAISWHISEILCGYNKNFYRVLFNELTKNAVFMAVSNPEKLNKNKYKAQQSRRILDRIVGYEMSSLLWKKVKRGISAGRVQSVSVRVICEREKKIQAYNPKEYWSVFAHLQNSSLKIFNTKLTCIDEKNFFLNKKGVLSKLKEKLNYSDFVVCNIKEKLKKNSPKPPFTTSGLQQEAIKKINFSAKKTMLIAQQLYEGVVINDGELAGLITYMRTDSIRSSDYSIRNALNFIGMYLGKNFVSGKPRFFKNKKKVQDSHEAIRPTCVLNTPEMIKPYLFCDQIKLYTIIWNRFVSSQVKKSVTLYRKIDIKSGKCTFAIGEYRNIFVGFKVFYVSKEIFFLNNKIIPSFRLDDSLKLKRIKFKKHFTAPPYRFSEASLVKELEERGVGRPSTYATIIGNIRNKRYISIIRKNCKPTELGFIVNDLLISVFPEVMNVEFTAKMEYKLDKIEQAKINHVKLLSDFYIRLNKKLDIAKRSMLKINSIGIATNIKCPECKKKQLRIKIGKNGRFISCSMYPKCTFSSDYSRDVNGNINIAKLDKKLFVDKKCNICSNSMFVKYGKYGKFLACSGFPKCKNTISINVSSKTQTICPEKHCLGSILEKVSRKGKIFYGCENFPNCNFASWNKPVNIKCSKCDSVYLVEKKIKSDSNVLFCPNSSCNYIEKK